jgi:hypothetical protein
VERKNNTGGKKGSSNINSKNWFSNQCMNLSEGVDEIHPGQYLVFKDCDCKAPDLICSLNRLCQLSRAS